MNSPLYEIITTETPGQEPRYTTVRNGLDGQRRVIGGRTPRLGFCYEAAWADFLATYGETQVHEVKDAQGRSHKKTMHTGKLLRPSLRPAFSVDFLPVPSAILKEVKVGS